jgi:F-type H+-transporting ATPase subunit c
MFELLTLAPMMLAELTLTDKGLTMIGGVLGCGVIVLGAARGIGGLASSAVEAIARQPEAGNRIFTTMIIAAALIEGVTLFALIICLLPIIR